MQVPAQIDLSIFMPCYNEEENIIISLDTCVRALATTSLSWEIIIVDDSSIDQSVFLIEQFMAEHPTLNLVFKKCLKNRGLAHNYMDAVMLARGIYYKQVCGDNAESFETLVKIFQATGKADMLIPYHASVTGRLWYRIILSRLYTLLVNLISGHSLRYYNGLGTHRRENVLRWHANYYGFGFMADIITRLLDQGVSYLEIPTNAIDRKKGRSKALTCANFISVGHFFLDLSIRRIGNRLNSDKSTP